MVLQVIQSLGQYFAQVVGSGFQLTVSLADSGPGTAA